MRKYYLLILLMIPSFFAIAQKEGVRVTDLLQINTAGNIVLTKDGSRAAFTLLKIEADTGKWEYKYVTQLWTVAMDGTPPRQLTFAKEGASQPAWSPDGKQLVFVRTSEGKPQLFLLNFDGGEAIQLTKFKYGASNPEWSKNGKHLLFVAQVAFKDLLADSLMNRGKTIPQWPFEKPGFTANTNLQPNSTTANPDGNLDAIRAYLANNEKDHKAKVLNKLNFQEESVTASNMNLGQIFITEPLPGATPRAITGGYYSFGNAHFISDSAIIMSGQVNDDINPDRVQESSIYRIKTNGTGMEKLLGEKGRSYRNPVVSASGNWLAFLYGPAATVAIDTLAILSLGTKTGEPAGVNFDRPKQAVSWSKDENLLYFTAQSNGGVVLNRFNRNTKKIEPLTDTASGVTSYALGNNKVLFSKTAPTNPSEIYLADAPARNAQQVSSFNTSWLAERKLSLPEKHVFTNEKGMSVEYWVMKPVGYEAGKKYPLLLEIHGGPTAMWGPGEASMWHEFQFYCARGYGVVYCNPRGSGGYGLEFLKGNLADWGTGPTSDVLTALDKTVSEGWADTARLLVTGGSYAGYLVSWIIGHDHRFKAACSQRGVYDLSTFFGEGNAWRLIPGYFGGYPWEKKVKDLLDEESPITYVNNIVTPYIIFHGENDLRTGIVQSEMLYKSLKVLGRPVEYVRHPGATHESTRSGNNRQRIDQMLRTYEFFERFIH